MFDSRVARNLVGSAKNSAVMTVMTSTPRLASHYRGEAVMRLSSQPYIHISFYIVSLKIFVCFFNVSLKIFVSCLKKYTFYLSISAKGRGVRSGCWVHKTGSLFLHSGSAHTHTHTHTHTQGPSSRLQFSLSNHAACEDPASLENFLSGYFINRL